MIAVLIDADNVSAKLATTILDWCRTKEPALAVRIFGDFASNKNSEWCNIARHHGYALVFQPNGGTGKNSTDIALTIQAMDLLQDGVVTAFCLASNDRDFVPLATRLRLAGRKVFAVGARLDDRMKLNCHDFLQIAALASPAPIPEDVPPLVMAYRQVVQAESIPLAALGQLLRKHAPQAVPSGKLRTALRDSGWFAEVGSRNDLKIVLKRQA